MSRIAIVFACVLSVLGPHAGGMAQERDRGDRVVLVTLDGVRVQEIFGGLDADVLASTLAKDKHLHQTRSYQRF